MSGVPETRYARTTDGLYLAYQASGSGPPLLEVTNGTLMSLDSASEQPRWQAYIERLNSFCTFVRFDRRGIGLSDPPRSADPPTTEQSAADALAVLDAEGIPEAAILGVSYGGLAALMLAATHPERVRALVLVNAFARLLRAGDYPAGIPAEVYWRFADELVGPEHGAGGIDDLPLMAPNRVGDASFAEWWRRARQRAASPTTARASFAVAAADVRGVLGSIQAPTLVIHCRDDAFVRVGHGRYLADHIPGARYEELDTADHVPWVSDVDIPGEIEEFLTGTRHVAPGNRVLATVVFTDIAGSTAQAAALGDEQWRDRLELHDQTVARQIERFGGRLVKTTGDGALATFDGPARAIHCAAAIRDAVRQLGLDVRAGIHAGEIEQRGGDVAGIAVHLAQRVQTFAKPGQVLVTRTVAELVVGSGLEFEDRGEQHLRDIPGSWQLFALGS